MDPLPFSAYDPRPSLEFVLCVLALAGIVALIVALCRRYRIRKRTKLLDSLMAAGGLNWRDMSEPERAQYVAIWNRLYPDDPIELQDRATRASVR